MNDAEEGTLEAAGGLILRRRLWLPEHPVATLLLVHGLGEHGGRYHEFACSLVDRGVAVYAYDQRGHGRSEGQRGHIDRFDHLLADIDSACHDLASIPALASLPRLVMGHSFGGLVVLAALHRGLGPWTAAVLSAPWLATKAPVPAWKRFVATRLEPFWPNAPFSAPVSPESLTADRKMQEAQRADPLNHSKVTPRLFFETERKQAEVLASQGLLPATLVLVPEADPLADPAVTADWATRRSGAGVELLRLPGLRHEPLNEIGRRDVYRAIGTWLDRFISPDAPSTRLPQL